MRVLITGAAGFIGSHLCKRLINDRVGEVIGIDNLNDYYDSSLKQYRLNVLESISSQTDGSRWNFQKMDISDASALGRLFEEYNFDIVINLAAQAGVLFSIDHPENYIFTNICGFYNILENCRKYEVKHLIYSSSSSVYGDNAKIPFAESDNTDNPVSLYAATKKCDEILASTYNRLYNIPITGLRFFTVYGPAGRPDMAYFKFTESLVKGENIKLYNYGNCSRDFTYVDDVVESIIKVMAASDGCDQSHKIYNIGNSHPETLMDFVHVLSEELKSAGALDKNFDIEQHIELVPMQKGDVPVTFSDTALIEKDFCFKPDTSLRTGLREFAKWYKKWIDVKTGITTPHFAVNI